MPPRRTLLTILGSALTLSGALAFATAGAARADEPIRVVATFTILGDMVQRIGGQHVALTTLVGPNGDSHVYQPTPADARALSDADVLVVNGLEFEGWLDRLVEASDFEGQRIVATTGIDPIAFEEGAGHDDHDDHDEKEAAHHGEDTHDDGGKHADDHDDHDDEHAQADSHDHHDHGAFDPHAWQSLGNAVAYVDAITAGLAKASPAHAGAFYASRAAYVDELEALDAEIRTLMAALPEDRRTVVTSHDAFQYFGRDYGLTFLAPQGLSTDSEASAKDVAGLIRQMREQSIAAVFVENITDQRLIQQIARETRATVGGTLFPGALSDADGPAPTYLDMMRHNATAIATALGS